MKSFILALLTLIGLIGIGIGLGESSILIIVLSILLTIVCAGIGFSTRGKVNERE